MNEIFHRVSIRKFEQRPVERDKILQILRAGMQAPSTGNQQPWEFYVVTNPEKIQALSKSHQYAGCAAGAPVLIVPVYRKEGLWLETDSIGLGGVWLGIAPEQERMDKVAEILSIPDNLAPFSIFVLGYPAEQREQQDRFDESRIHYVE